MADKKPISVYVMGAAGRMGRAVIREILAAEDASLAGGAERAGAAELGVDLGALVGEPQVGKTVDASPPADFAGAAAVIDFTAPAASVETAAKAAQSGIAHIIGSTGFSDAETAALNDAASRIPIVKSGNMSLGVNLLAALVEEAARRLSDTYDIEIFEAHHRRKADAPSGAAYMLAEAAAAGRGIDLKSAAAGVDSGRAGARARGAIGFSVFRGGGVIGEHSVSFAAEDEVVTLSHSAIDRGLFARGAIAAAQWALVRPPGLYSMRDVLGL